MPAIKNILLASAAITAMMVSANAADRVVNIFNWSDYIDESVLSDFTKETGIKVVYDVFDSNEILETKLLAGGSGYDIVVPSGTFLARQISAGVFQKLDKSKLPNSKNLWDDILKRTETYDPGNAYSINYMWGTTGIGYNIGKVKAALGDVPVDSWDLIFKPENLAKLKECGVHMLDAPTEMLPAALNYLGKNPDSRDKAELAEAAKVLEGIRSSVLKFHQRQGD